MGACAPRFGVPCLAGALQYPGRSRRPAGRHQGQRGRSQQAAGGDRCKGVPRLDRLWCGSQRTFASTRATMPWAKAIPTGRAEKHRSPGSWWASGQPCWAGSFYEHPAREQDATTVTSVPVPAGDCRTPNRLAGQHRREQRPLGRVRWCTLTMKNHFGTFDPQTLRRWQLRPNHANFDYLLAINQSEALIGGETPCSASASSIRLGGPRAESGAPGRCHPSNRIVMGTFSPVVDFLTMKGPFGMKLWAVHSVNLFEEGLWQLGFPRRPRRRSSASMSTPMSHRRRSRARTSRRTPHTSSIPP